MGTLHAGHKSLVTNSQTQCDVTIASVFVNPLQFNDRRDLDAYPRQPESDIADLHEWGTDAVFIPHDDSEMYGKGFASFIDTAVHRRTKESLSRPSHFRGVCTVVGKLFNLVRPERAFFGQKDFVQCATISRFARDLSFGVDVIACPTIREESGLAMSSRNVRLTEKDIRIAPVLYKALVRGRDVYRECALSGIDGSDAVESARVISEVLATLATEITVQLDCCGIADVATMEEIQRIPYGDCADTDNAFRAPAVLHLAATLGDVRLLDNIALSE